MTEYVNVMGNDCWGMTVTEDEHASACARATEWLTEHEGSALSIWVRPPRRGECAGLYRGPAHQLRTTRHDGPELDTVRELVELAYEHACETWPVQS